MYFVMDAHSFYNFIYFILLIIVSVSSSFVGMEDAGEMDRGSPERGLAWSEVLTLSASLIEIQAEGPCPEELGGNPKSRPVTYQHLKS